jgi:PAS domain S-box-containing protein
MDAILLIEGSHCVDCNRRSMEMLGCKKEDILGHTMIEFSPPFQLNGEDSEKALSQHMGLVMEGRPQFFEWKLKRKDGLLIDAEISLNRVDIEKATYIQAFIRDITVRKEIEEMLLAQPVCS